MVYWNVTPLLGGLDLGLLIISLYGYFVVVYLPSCSMSRLPARGRRPRDGKKGLSARREIINNKINHIWEITFGTNALSFIIEFPLKEGKGRVQVDKVY